MLDADLLTRANNHELDAMMEVANAYYRGIGVELDDEEMFKWYSNIIKLAPDCAEALCRLGNCYNFGWGVEENPDKAVELYKKAANLNDVEAHYQLACAYKDGIGTEKNYELAVQHFSIAIDGKNSDAMVELGDMYNWGIGIEQNYILAVKYYKLASEEEDSKGMFALGYAYFFGNGIERNEVLANDYFKKSAELNYAPSQYVLGINYMNGYGIEKDTSKGIYWLEKASEQKYVKSILAIAEFYYKGTEVEKNKEKAKEYFIKAHQLGDRRALTIQLDLYMQDKELLDASAWAKRYIDELLLPEQDKEYYSFLIVLFLYAYSGMKVAGADKSILDFILLDKYINKFTETVKNIDEDKINSFGTWKLNMGFCAWNCTDTSYKQLSKKWWEDAYKCGVYTSCLWLYNLWYKPEEITNTFYHNMVLALNEEAAKEDIDVLLYSLAEMNIYGRGTEKNLALAYEYARQAAEKGYEPAKEMLCHFKKNFFGTLTYEK